MPERHITTTTRHPFRTAVSIYVTWQNGTRTRGTGVMVGRNDVLTAAHVVYNPSRGRAVSYTVHAGQNGTTKPYGSVSGTSINYSVINYSAGNLLTNSEAGRDYALITLPTNLGDRTGYMGLRSNVSGNHVRFLNSYPSHRARSFQNLRMMQTWGRVSAVNGSYLDTRSLTYSSGSSGGGIYVRVGNSYYVTGVVSTGNGTSGAAGAYINTARFNTIRRWINSNNIRGGGRTNGGVTHRHNLGVLTRRRVRTGTVNYNSNRVDSYAFRVNGTRRVTAQLAGLRSDADIYLYNVRGTLITSSRRSGTSADAFARTLRTGTYRIEVRQYTNTRTTNRYRLTVTPRVVRRNVTQNYNLGTLTGRLVRRGNVNYHTNRTDTYTFTLTGARRLNVQLAQLRSDADIYLYNSAGTLVANARRGGRSVDAFNTDLAAGTYRLEVRQYTNTRAANTYRLVFTPRIPPAAAPASANHWAGSLASDALVAGGDGHLTVAGRNSATRTSRRNNPALAHG